MSIGALYIHVPFCASKCRYCDFDSVACQDGDVPAHHADAVASWLDRARASHALDPCRTAYIGGGTPSLLGPRLAGMVGAVRAAAPAITELTCEANPESFDAGLAGALSSAGATRVSLGVQSFCDRELHALGRIHDADRARAAIRAALDAGLDTSIDLMCGIPHQTRDSWRATLAEAVSSGVGHVSVYPLSIEEGTPFGRALERGEMDEPDEDFQAWCMEEARRVLRAAGLAPYEVASYARAGARCRHNIAYWTGVGYLGLGRSAASMLARADYDAMRPALGLPEVAPGTAHVRFVQAGDSLPGTADADFDIEELSAQEAMAEDLMLGMRMTCGVGPGLLRSAGEVLGAERVRAAAGRAVAAGLASWTDEGRLAPTERGWLLGNELYGMFWDLARP